MIYLFYFNDLRESGTELHYADSVHIAELSDNGLEIIRVKSYPFLHNADTNPGLYDYSCLLRIWSAILSDFICYMHEYPVCIFQTKLDMRIFMDMIKLLKIKSKSIGVFNIESLTEVNYTEHSDVTEIFSQMKKIVADNILSRDEIKRSLELQTRNRIIFNTGYNFIGNKTTRVYHSKNRNCTDRISLNEIVGLGANPWTQGFRPCPICFINNGHYSANSPNKTAAVQNYIKPAGINKSEVIKNQIIAFCEEYGMHAEIKNGVAYITTLAGEWFFMYNDRPITLKHRSSDKRFYSNGAYHVQNIEFHSPLYVLAYIYKHEMAEKNRIMNDIASNAELYAGINHI